MTPFWLASLSLLFATFAGVFVPRRRSGSDSSRIAQANVSVYRQQLAELASELCHRRITQEYFDRERGEIEQRLARDLRASEGRDKDTRADAPVVTVYWFGLMTLLAAVLLYLAIGAPPWASRSLTGSVDGELLRRNEYLVTENRILRAQIPGRVTLTDGERRTFAPIGKPLGRKVLVEIASIVRPETILAWHRRLVARKFDGSKKRRYPGRPAVERGVEELVVRFATDNRDGGYEPHRRGPGQSRLRSERPDGRQHPETPGHPPCPGPQEDHDLEGIHSLRAGCDGFLHD